MCGERDIMSQTSGEKRTAVGWLRSALSGALVVAPVSQRVRKPTQRLIGKAPDWIMAGWADATNLDLLHAYRACPDIASVLSSDAGKAAVQQYVEAHDAVATVNALEALVRTVLNLLNQGGLLVDGEMVIRHAFALAMAGFMPQGKQFAGAAKAILSNSESSNQLLIDYRTALQCGDKRRLRALDDALNSTAYSAWVAERLTETRCWLGLEPPRFCINYGERTPQWDTLWGNIIKGGN